MDTMKYSRRVFGTDRMTNMLEENSLSKYVIAVPDWRAVQLLCNRDNKRQTFPLVFFFLEVRRFRICITTP